MKRALLVAVAVPLSLVAAVTLAIGAAAILALASLPEVHR